jgi:hypothetical protein
MAYIGREPQIGNFQVCDNITVVNGQAAYTMQVNSVNVSPETANHCLVSLNGVLQKSSGTSPSFTISGSTITFASNLVTGDVIDFIHILGSVLDLGVPSDSTVSLAKLTATGTKDATTFLRGDNTFAAAGGDVALLTSGTLSSASSLALSSTYITSTYQYYDLLITGYSATNNFQTYMRTSTDNGSAYNSGASDYGWMFTSTGTQAGYASIADQDDTGVVINDEQSDGAATGFAHRIRITNPMSSTHATQFQWTGVGHHQSNDDVKALYGVGFRQAAEANNNIATYFSQTVTGSYVLYGIKGS